MRRKMILLLAVAVAAAFLASCNLGGTGCDVQAKTQTGGGGTAGSRASDSVCGTTTNSTGGSGDKGMGGGTGTTFAPSGPSCSSKAGHTRFLYVGDLSTGNIDSFGLGTDGHVEFLCHSANMDKAVTAMTVAGNAFLYGYSSTNAHMFAYKADGPVLTPLAGSPLTVGSKWELGLTSPLAMDPSGRFLFIGGYAGSGVSVLSINSTTGALTPVAGSPFVDGFTGVKNAVHPSGSFYYSFQGTTINQFAVGTAGLTPLPVPTVGYFVPDTATTGGSVTGIRIDPSGKYLYVLAARSISFYRVDQSTGQLSFATDVLPASLENNSMPWDFVIDPSGRFLYVGDPGSSTTLPGWVDSFAIDGALGALTTIPGQPFLTGEGDPHHLIADPDGQHVWVVVGNSAGAAIFGMAIDSTTGALGIPAVTPTTYNFDPNSPIAIVVQQ